MIKKVLNYREMYKNYKKNKMEDTGFEYTQESYDRWIGNVKKVINVWLPRNKNAKCVDLGCGNGNILMLLRNSGYKNIEGVDISKDQVETARKHFPEVKEGNAMDYIKNIKNKYDLITTFDMIEHLDKEELYVFVKRLYCALKPGGRLILHTLNADGPFFGGMDWGACLPNPF